MDKLWIWFSVAVMVTVILLTFMYFARLCDFHLLCRSCCCQEEEDPLYDSYRRQESLAGRVVQRSSSTLAQVVVEPRRVVGPELQHREPPGVNRTNSSYEAHWPTQQRMGGDRSTTHSQMPTTMHFSRNQRSMDNVVVEPRVFHVPIQSHNQLAAVHNPQPSSQFGWTQEQKVYLQKRKEDALREYLRAINNKDTGVLTGLHWQNKAIQPADRQLIDNPVDNLGVTEVHNKIKRGKKNKGGRPSSSILDDGPKFYLAKCPFNPSQPELVLAVDATPRWFGGYLVNPIEKRVSFYSIPFHRIPWVLRDRTKLGNSEEFEMKNMLCGLLQWSDTIVAHKLVRIYTDNFAVFDKNSEYGRRVTNFIRHLRNCEGVTVSNGKQMVLGSKHKPIEFEKYIGPADHLSRKRVDDFKKAMLESYSAEFGRNAFKFWDERTLKNLDHAVSQWSTQACLTCGFTIEHTGSFKEDHLNSCKSVSGGKNSRNSRYCRF